MYHVITKKVLWKIFSPKHACLMKLLNVTLFKTNLLLIIRTFPRLSSLKRSQPNISYSKLTEGDGTQIFDARWRYLRGINGIKYFGFIKALKLDHQNSKLKQKCPLNRKQQRGRKGTSSVAFQVLTMNCKIDSINLFIFNYLELNINLFIFDCLTSNFCFRKIIYLVSRR